MSHDSATLAKRACLAATCVSEHSDCGEAKNVMKTELFLEDTR